MHIAVLSNTNFEPLKSFLLTEEVYFCNYGRYMEEIIDENSYINSHDFEIVLLQLDGDELAKEVLNTLMVIDELCKLMEKKLFSIFQGIEQYLQRYPQTKVIISTISFSPFTFLNYLDTNSEYSFRTLEAQINKYIIDFSLTKSMIYVLDWTRIILLHGYNEIVDDKFWYLGRIKYSHKAYSILARELQNIIRAIQGQTKKVLILDLDNTLWGGTIGEDGIDGIELSEDGKGKAYRDFQYAVKSLMNLGVLLAVNSKNNREDIENLWATHPMMVLKKEDFVSIQINWDSKVENMKMIAQELNLGLDSFVFIDDNPRERELIKQYLPEIEVPDFPQDTVYLKRWLVGDIGYTYFPKVFITQEDKKKVKQYKSSVERGKLSKGLSLDGFLRSLNIKIGFYVDNKRFIKRTAQLTQKTNQFNMTTRRYAENEIKFFMECNDSRVFNIDYTDKFGNEGIIGTAIVNNDNNCSCFDSFLMSCRVIGRNIEHTFLYKIVRYLKEHATENIICEFIPTKKNIVARDFYKNIGFECIEQKNGVTYFRSTVTEILEEKEKRFKHEIFE
jgi:FkbH-like protein